MPILGTNDDLEPTTTPTTGPKADTPFFLRKALWGFATLAMAFFAVDGYFTIEIQSGAPQQAAAAGMACFKLVTPYVIARALDQLLRGPLSQG